MPRQAVWALAEIPVGRLALAAGLTRAAPLGQAEFSIPADGSQRAGRQAWPGSPRPEAHRPQVAGRAWIPVAAQRVAVLRAAAQPVASAPWQAALPDVAGPLAARVAYQGPRPAAEPRDPAEQVLLGEPPAQAALRQRAARFRVLARASLSIKRGSSNWPM